MLNFDCLPKCLPSDTEFIEHNDCNERRVFKVDYLEGTAAPYCLYYGLESKLTSETEQMSLISHLKAFNDDRSKRDCLV